MKHAFGALAIGSSLWAGGALAYSPPQTLAHCLAPLPDSPDLVQETAQDWLHHGGGRSAHECLAQADLALGAYRDAATEFEGLAAPEAPAAIQGGKGQQGHGASVPAGPALPSHAATAQDGHGGDTGERAVFAEQAAAAWLLAGDGKAAERAARQALSHDSGPLGCRVLLARSLSMQGQFAATVAALGALPGDGPALPPTAPAVAKPDAVPDPYLVGAFVVRATAYRYLGQSAKAMADANRALALSPDDVEALLERGILNVRLRQYGQARQDWDRVITLAPDGHEAYLARQDEAVLDADPDQD